jgi:ABC-type transport system involved in multi-copper enzyme maturation permease subunit
MRPVVAAGGAGMGRSVRAEWTKLRTLPSTAWLLLAIAALTTAVSAAAALPVDTAHCPSPAECYEDTVKVSLSGVRVGQAVAVVLAVLAISGEYGGTLRTTLAVQPRRLRVLLAKAAVIAVVVAVAGVAGVAGSLAAGQLILPGNGFTPANGYPGFSVTDTTMLRAAGGTVLYLVLIAWLALGAATALRDTAGSITAVLGLLFCSPILVLVLTDPDWKERVERFTPMNAGLAIQSTTQIERLPIGPWTGLGVLALYSAAALILGSVSFVRRDQ